MWKPYPTLQRSRVRENAEIQLFEPRAIRLEMLQRSRVRENAEISRIASRREVLPELQRSRVRENAEIDVTSANDAIVSVRFNGAASVRTRKLVCHHVCCIPSHGASTEPRP